MRCPQCELSMVPRDGRFWCEPCRLDYHPVPNPSELLAEMLGGELPTTWWWLSFASETGWLGAAIVEGWNLGEAAARAWKLGCNPGGEVYGVSLRDVVPPPEFRDRLLTKEECKAFDKAMGGAGAVCSPDGEPR